MVALQLGVVTIAPNREYTQGVSQMESITWLQAISGYSAGSTAVDESNHVCYFPKWICCISQGTRAGTLGNGLEPPWSPLQTICKPKPWRKVSSHPSSSTGSYCHASAATGVNFGKYFRCGCYLRKPKVKMGTGVGNGFPISTGQGEEGSEPSRSQGIVAVCSPHCTAHW